jgi:hypothetical protein
MWDYSVGICLNIYSQRVEVCCRHCRTGEAESFEVITDGGEVGDGLDTYGSVLLERRSFSSQVMPS